MNQEFDFYSPTSLKSYDLNESIRYQLNVLSTLDVFTRKHSENVGNLTLKLCQKLRMNKKFTVYCTICGYLHDIGKTFIPPEILQKKSRLTDEEFEIIKTHTTIGYKMCMKDLKLRPYAIGTLYHHESLDGSGYPNGVTEDELPYEAQIIRVADEYDAMVSKRQYKSHINISETLESIIGRTKPTPDDPKSKKKNVGKLDSEIVRALIEVVKEDIDYEINCVFDYTEYLKKNIQRLENIEKLYEEMKTFNSEKDQKYYMSIINKSFEPNENLDNYKIILADYKKAFDARNERIKKLFDEQKKVKKMEC